MVMAMDYEQKYKKALERAREELGSGCFDRGTVEYIFPELKESDDERISREITEFILTHRIDTPNDIEDTDTWIAWLEKQGETREINPTLQEKERMDDAFTKMMFKGKTALEAIHEEKVDNANKAEPKFHEGDWIINKSHDICLITDIDLENGYYICESNRFGNTDGDIDLTDKAFHLWTIEDAKEGDVLVYGDNPADHHLRIIMLFKSMRNFNSAFNHFHIFDDEFRINEWCDCGKTAHPATKEQRKLLFQKMKEAGYEWDEEKKELKKIKKQSEQNSPILSNSSNIGKDLQVDGFDAELNALLKKYEHLSKKELQEPLEFYLGVVRDDLDIVREEKPKWN